MVFWVHRPGVEADGTAAKVANRSLIFQHTWKAAGWAIMENLRSISSWVNGWNLGGDTKTLSHLCGQKVMMCSKRFGIPKRHYGSSLLICGVSGWLIQHAKMGGFLPIRSVMSWVKMSRNMFQNDLQPQKIWVPKNVSWLSLSDLLIVVYVYQRGPFKDDGTIGLRQARNTQSLGEKNGKWQLR